ncbi:probable serine/threonine-protein kinase sky1 [Zingiber officinale]|uniref:probable serine/threonine-protein kinase sky1 n=1 Tax=Zingiber officinale TaxID=94328 RepID=UPI001C4D065B|nr:probable serine/threonine-protein kinase sky1 [Zingiber officinale]
MEFFPETMYRVLKHYSNVYQRMPLVNMKLYMYQIFRGLSYIHNILRIFHRDVKPQNLLLEACIHPFFDELTWVLSNSLSMAWGNRERAANGWYHVFLMNYESIMQDYLMVAHFLHFSTSTSKSFCMLCLSLSTSWYLSKLGDSAGLALPKQLVQRMTRVNPKPQFGSP